MKGADSVFPSIAGLDQGEAIEVVVRELEKIEKRDTPGIFGMDGINTVNDLIRHVRDKTPQGLEMLELWQKAEGTLNRVQEERSNGLGHQIRVTTRGEILTGYGAATTSSGQLNPEHSRWLMGFPAAWASAIPGHSDWLKWQGVMQQVSNAQSDTESQHSVHTEMPLSNPSRGNS